jgi:predicted RNase H-like nuclease (RuvC/YqgF family)
MESEVIYMNEKLKEILGEELYNKVIEAMGDTPIESVIGEGKIPLDRFNEVNTAKKTLEAQVQTLTSERDTLKSKVTELESKVQTTAYEAQVKEVLSKSGAKNTETVKRLLDIEGKTLEEVQTAVDALKKSDPYLFNGNKVTGNTPKNTNNGDGGVTKEDFAKMNYRERVALYERDKALYDSLVKS